MPSYADVVGRPTQDSISEAGGPVEYPLDIGDGMFRLSNGEEVKGKAAAKKAEKALAEAEGEAEVEGSGESSDN